MIVSSKRKLLVLISVSIICLILILSPRVPELTDNPQQASQKDVEGNLPGVEKHIVLHPVALTQDPLPKVEAPNRLSRVERMLGRKINHEDCTKVLPQAIIIGVMKCGTEALTLFLSIHPDIAMQLKHEAVEFFQENYDKGLEWYRNQMACSSSNQITMEKSPQYFYAQDVPKRLHGMNSSIKLIAIVKEPISRAISHYHHIRRSKTNTYTLPFEDTVRQSAAKKDHIFLRRSKYVVGLRQWLDYFDLEQIHIVDGDNFRNNPMEELKKVEVFLGIRSYITPDKFTHNSAKGFYCMNVTGKASCLAATKGLKHPDVNPAVFDELKDLFKPYNEEFFNITRRRFDWGY